MKKLFIPVLTCCLLFIHGTGNAQQSAKPRQAGAVKIFSFAPTVPVLKRLATNPVLCVKIYVPAGTTGTRYRSIEGSLNKEGVKAIEKIEVYFTGTEPLFGTKNLIATLTSPATKFSIPVKIDLGPGWHYAWLSATLKQDADIEHSIELYATGLTDVNNKIQPITEHRSAFKKLSGVALRNAWDDSVNSYRIPGIITTDRGTLISVYDVRYVNSGDLPGNIDVGMNRSTDGGKTWEPMKIIMDMGAPHENNGVGDPAILFDPVTKKIWVAALWSKGNRSIAGSKPGLSPDTTGQFVLVSSGDDGLTWSAPQSITPQVKDPAWHLFFNGPGNGIAMKDGKIVFAAQYWDEKRMPWSTIIFSDDHGSNWKGKLDGPKANTTESQVVETNPGTLMLNMRDNRGSFRSVATTKDMGGSWTEHYTSYNALPDPVCMGSIIKARVNVKGQMKDVLFFSNPNSSEGRINLTIKASLDLGETWLPLNQLLVDERKSFGYSALTKIDDNTIGILYEGTRDIYFLRIPVAGIIR
ncbi:MAG: exo-alpha-sialidase [Bacteroidota bacterium]